MNVIASNDVEQAINLYRAMVRIRVFEERVDKLFRARKLPGFVHLYLGEEAVAAGVCSVLKEDDYITSTHRGHGHAIAKGVEFRPLIAELYGKVTGVCKGRGGSMHVADFGLGVLGANGIVGGGFGLAAGAALSSTLLENGRVAVCFFGDGGMNKGTFHEALNFAAVKRLPVVYVCENNQFAQYTSRSQTTAVTQLAQRADSYGMPGFSVDGNDAIAVRSVATGAVEAARSGKGPTLVVCETYRYGGHFVGDAEAYRQRSDVLAWEKLDPIERLAKSLTQSGIDQGALDAHWQSARSDVDDAVEFAEASSYPDPADALEGLYA